MAALSLSDTLSDLSSDMSDNSCENAVPVSLEERFQNMTGNTKVWRAPLAGLASVAMIATMGVAASTANAAPSYRYPDVTVTLDPNGGEFVSRVAGVQSDGTVKLTDAYKHSVDGYAYADGVFEDLYKTYGYDGTTGADGNIKWDGKGARRFSGWYTEKQGGQAVDPTAALTDGTTLYAHWSQGASSTDESEGAVKFVTDGKVTSTNPDGQSNVVTVDSNNDVYVFLADGDTLADWEVPSTDVTDYQVFDHWDGGTVATAKAGVTLKAVTVAGTKLTINRQASNTDSYPSYQFDLYKDGVKATTAGSVTFDVARKSTLAGWQAVTPSSKKLATGWSVNAGDGFKDFAVTDALPDVNDVTVAPKGPGVQATVVRVHKWNKTVVDARYFVASGTTFTQSVGQALADVKRVNTTFLGWFDKDQNVTYIENNVTVSKTNDDFFEANLIRVFLLDKADPVAFSFDKTINQNNAGIDLYAGYDTEAPFTTVTFDPNYSGAEKISQKIYWGKKLADQVPSVTRDGYTLVGWYNVPNPTDLSKQKLDTSKVADERVPGFGTYYAVWTADSKFGVNGLLANLARGYATGKSDKGYATFTNSPSKPVKLVKDGKDENGVQKYKEGASGEFVLANPGYVETTWKAFVKSRDEVVVPALIKELNLAKDADIATVYEAVATKLSAEKADEFNRLFSSVASDSASFPDVNYNDYGTHSDEITKLYKKGIVKGYQDGTFGYGAPLARVDYIVWLYRAAGSPDADASAAGFSDVNAATVPNEDFRKAIAWAKSAGVTEGYKDGTFAPYAPLNRQDAAAFLYRAAGSPKYNEDYADVKFADVTPGDAANHSQAVLWAAHNQIAKGYSGSVNKFSGYTTLVRQDAAAFLARTLDAGYIAK